MSETVAATEEEIASRPLCPPPFANTDRLGSPMSNRLNRLNYLSPSRKLSQAAAEIPQIRYWEQQYGNLSASELIAQANRLRGRARARKTDSGLIAEAFGLCSVAVWRVSGMRPYDVQLAAGVVMHHGAAVELATGEGKTLTAIFPVFLNALAGKGVHVATVNDYLAKRDADEVTGPVYSSLGLSVGVLQQKMEDAARVDAYKRDITYATASEFGFDFLRDRMKVRGGQTAKPPVWSSWLSTAKVPMDPRVQRGHYYAVVDEADSIFIDEARTPLIISAPTRIAGPEEARVYHWADGVATKMQAGVHFQVDLKKDKIDLTEAGKKMTRFSKPPAGTEGNAFDKLFENVERALHTRFRFVRDHHYMIHEGKVVIIDENTGRPMPDRHWREGLHQAVEAREKVDIHLAADHAASVTFQNFFKLYKKLTGMSGTVIQNAGELKRIYNLTTVAVPTNRPVIRQQYPDLVLPTEEAKFDAIVAQTREMVLAGRPVLIGTRSVEKSEALSKKLTDVGVAHRVLNARQNEAEANVISEAGQPGRVTVATNMAGRGTDIKLGTGVAAAGGLHVIGTERHEAIRIDRQLLGRAGRQGDPGSGQFFLSMEDQLLEALGDRRRETLTEMGRRGGNRDWNEFRNLFVRSQRRTERKHVRQRLDLMHYDKQRKELLADLGADPFVD